MTRTLSVYIGFLSCLILALSVAGFAQEFRATLTGRITDPSGGAIAGAEVRVKNLQTNEESIATTEDNGNYTVPFLIPGKYNVTVETPGFRKAVNENLELHVNDRATLNFTLEVGQLEQAINVTSETPLLEPDTATRGQVIENLRINELPLNAGRNPIMLATLATGV